MTEAMIWAYIILNSFLAGLAVALGKEPWIVAVTLLFGCLIAAILNLWRLLVRIGDITEIMALIRLALTDRFADPGWQEVINTFYHKVTPYKKWVFRQIARKYGYVIPPKE